MLSEPEALIRILVAALLGAVVGAEREVSDKPAGLRTHMLVAEGAALFMVGSILLTQEFGQVGGSISVDPSRVASTIVTGVGFLGGGMILKSEDRIYGLTTAAGIWVAAAIGFLVGGGHFVLAVGATLIAVATLLVLRLPERWLGSVGGGRYEPDDDD